MVTDSPSKSDGDGGESRPSLFRYTERFEALCGYYLSLGMSYEDYWDGDACKVKYYRQKDNLDKERRNHDLWLQAVYIYEALLDASPMFNPLSKKKGPYPFRENPIPLTESESKRLNEMNKQKQLENGREAMRAMMIEINKKFEEKRKKGGK